MRAAVQAQARRHGGAKVQRGAQAAVGGGDVRLRPRRVRRGRALAVLGGHHYPRPPGPDPGPARGHAQVAHGVVLHEGAPDRDVGRAEVPDQVHASRPGPGGLRRLDVPHSPAPERHVHRQLPARVHRQAVDAREAAAGDVDESARAHAQAVAPAPADAEPLEVGLVRANRRAAVLAPHGGLVQVAHADDVPAAVQRRPDLEVQPRPAVAAAVEVGQRLDRGAGLARHLRGPRRGGQRGQPDGGADENTLVHHRPPSVCWYQS